MRSHGCRGYTLIELLISTSIIGMLFVAVPSLAKILGENRQRSQIMQLQRLVQLARSHAISTGQVTTLCGIQDGVHCGRDWSSPVILVFKDSDNDHAVGNKDMVIGKVVLDGGRWHWGTSRRASYLRFSSDGSPKEYGTFTLCPLSSAINHGTQLVLNSVGRPYTKEVSRAALQAAQLCN